VDETELAEAVRAALRLHRPHTVAVPLGLFHRDHQRACDAALRVLHERNAGDEASCPWIAYEDALYRDIGGLLQQRLAQLAQRGIAAEPVTFDAPPGRAAQRKRQAVRCYASQLRGLSTPGRPGIRDALKPERYWALKPGAGRDPLQPISCVILTHNRVEELMQTLARVSALPERPSLVVVDNGSADGTPAMVRERFPAVRVIALPSNIGAAARNVGVREVQTPYVAFCDDDTAWKPGALKRAVELMEAHPQIAVLTARVLVGVERREDPACTVMARSPLPSEGLPGRAVLGFLAGASVFRRAAFLDAGGYEPKFFIGAEEALMSLDLVSRGWRLVYTRELEVHHYPSSQRDSRGRRRLLARNALWVAWLRRPVSGAVRRSLQIIGTAWRDRARAAGCLEALTGLPWVLRHRRVITPQLEAWCGKIE